VVSPTRAELYYDPRRLLPTTDPTGAFTIMGLAIFVEYLRIAVRSRGYDLRDAITEAPLDFFSPRLERVATLELVPAESPVLFDRRLILERKTSRLPYDGHVVEDEALQALAGIAARHGHQVGWSSDDAMVRWTMELNRFTMFDDLAEERTREELRRWMRYSSEDAQQSPDGLWSHCMRVPGWLMRNFFEDHARWGSGWRKRLSGDLLMRGMRGTRTVAWWSGPFRTPADWLATGRILAHTWLELTRRGIQLHPFGSVVTNPRAHAQLVERIGVTEGDNQLWLLVRLGRSDTPPRSHRIDTARLFITDKELA
jgi:hypothetical protein